MVDLEKNSWKGIAWNLFFLWPIFIYFMIQEIQKWESIEINETLIIIGLIGGSILWVFGLYKLIQLLKDPFGSKGNESNS